MASDDPTFFLLDQVPWPEGNDGGTTSPGAPAPPQELVDAARSSGACRKFLARGEGGFHSQYSEFPAGFTVPRHRHDHDEMLVVLDGAATMLGGGPTLAAHDSMVLIGGYEYGFTAGDDGLKLLTIRTGAASTTLT